MDPFTVMAVAKGLAQFVPAIAGWFGGDDAEATATKVVDAAKVITGIDDPSKALDAIRNDTELQTKLQQAMVPVMVERIRARAEELKAINETMRAEYQNDDKFKSYWRPMFGWVVSISFLLTVIGAFLLVGIAMFGAGNIGDVVPATGKLSVGEAISAISELVQALVPIWIIALSVLGVNITKRSNDKQLASGFAPAPGLLQSVIQRFGRGNG